ncbi:MAG: sugar ABC transporter ATP-binding protein [Chloroflexota bacterium]
MTEPPLLQMRQISKSYEGTQALRAVDFSAVAGEVHAIVGENGAGKSTLVKILSGAVRRDRGQILLDGDLVEIDNPFQAHELGIRAVYQEFSLIPHLSITENILMGQMPTSSVKWLVDWPSAHRQAQDILDGIGFSGFNVKTRVSRLSVPHQQMVEIAKALAGKPRILILDEPSAVLSHEEIRSLFALIRQLKNEQSTLVLYISHRIDELFEVADRITVLKDGELVGTVRPSETNQDQLIKMMVGRTLDEIYPPGHNGQGENVLQVNGLSRQEVFSDVSFTLARGEILGLFGLVGSGRTEVARCIFGAEQATSGDIALRGQRFRPKNPRIAVAAGIAYLTEDRKRDGLVMTCSMRDNASLASLPEISQWGLLNRRQQTDRIEAKIRELDIRPPHLERLVRQFSGGNQQKVVFAKWLLVHADVLILDEPTRGVDVATKVEIYQIIRDLADQGRAILLISSEMPEILGMSDRVLVMREGRLVGELAKAQATEEKLLALAAVANQEA